MPGDIACGPKRATHRVFDDERPWNAQLSGPVLECFYHDCHCGNARLLYRSCNVSDRHVTDRSDRHEEHEVNVLFLDLCDPFGKGLAEPTLGRCSGE